MVLGAIVQSDIEDMRDVESIMVKMCKCASGSSDLALKVFRWLSIKHGLFWKKHKDLLDARCFCGPLIFILFLTRLGWWAFLLDACYRALASARAYFFASGWILEQPAPQCVMICSCEFCIAANTKGHFFCKYGYVTGFAPIVAWLHRMLRILWLRIVLFAFMGMKRNGNGCAFVRLACMLTILIASCSLWQYLRLLWRLSGGFEHLLHSARVFECGTKACIKFS